MTENNTLKEMFRRAEEPLVVAREDELSILLKVLSRLSGGGDYSYVVLHTPKNNAVLLFQPSLRLLYSLLSCTDNKYIDRKFEDYREAWNKANEVAELVVEVHRSLKEPLPGIIDLDKDK